MCRANLALAIEAARCAGDAILTFYRQVITVKDKSDGSPFTQADHVAHEIITGLLRDTHYPVVSEEGDDLLLDASEYWLVDPLDGTKDFLAGNDEFTVNIAFIHSQRPVLGVVFAPALDELFTGEPEGAWANIQGARIRCQQADRSDNMRMAVSRFHDHPDVDVFANANRVGERVAMGSALKYGRLALGRVDVFPRLVGSSEWDTAAGQAVLEAAGGQVLDWETGQPLRYGKPRRRNPRLISLRASYHYDEFELIKYGSPIP